MKPQLATSTVGATPTVCPAPPGGRPIAPLAKGGSWLSPDLVGEALRRPLAFAFAVIPTGAARFFASRHPLARRAPRRRDHGNTSAQSPSMEQPQSLNLARSTN